MNLFSRRCFILAGLLTLASFAAAAKPNLSGNWKLNVAKSDFGPLPTPESMSFAMTHEEPALKIAVKQVGEQGEVAYDFAYTTDGKESKNAIRENSIVSVVAWESEVLTFKSKGTFGDVEVTMNDKWTVSADGKVLTIERHLSSSYGEADQKMIFEKQ